MLKRKIQIIVCLVLIYHTGSGQIKIEPSPINWYSIEQADSMNNKNAKPIFIDVYTDWCGWCKYMMQTTFANPDIANYINNNFYPVRFDAETTDTVVFRNKSYVNKGNGIKAKHELAYVLLNNQFSFPTIVYLTKNNAMTQIPGYMSVKEIEPVLIWFAEEVYINCSFDEWKMLYYNHYAEQYKDESIKEKIVLISDTTGRIDWNSFKDASDLSLKEKKPIFIYLYTDWCGSCKIFTDMVLKNKIISEYINLNFYAVKFNAASQSDEYLYGQKFSGSGVMKPHQLSYTLLKQSFKFPAIVIISSEKQKLDEIHGFLTSRRLETIINYFGSGAYLNIIFENFMKDFKGKINEM